jgi:acyl-CoA hydrolase
VESYTVVRPEHLNHFGYLFGGQMLKWVDEIAWIAASRDHPGCSFVTVAMDKVEFRRSVRQGTVLRFEVAQERCGTTSVAYAVQVLAEHPDTGAEAPVFSTHIWFVCLDTHGRKMPLRRI